MKKTARSSSSPAWILCLILLLALLGAGWFVWSDLASEQAAAAEPAPEASGQAAEGESRLPEQQLAALRGWLEAEPCDIPDEVLGLMLVPAAPSAEPEEDPADAPEALPGAEQTLGNVPEKSALVEYSASNEAIEAASVLVLADTGEGIAMGTGFFVAPGVVLTNQHVVGKASGRLVLVNSTLGLAQGRVVAATAENDRDYALIRLQADDLSLPEPLPLCGDIRKADKVGAWGFPGALSKVDPKFQALLQGDTTALPENVYSEGVVNVIYDTMPPMVLHTAVLSHGNSGGPLVNEDGCVVGINTLIQMDQETYRQTSVALASKDIATYLWQNGITARYRSGRR